MDLRQLRYFVALADERHFTRAAAREHIAQPALSQAIRRLEAEAGVALVQRTTRRVELTSAGGALVERARRILAEVEAARAELRDHAGIRAGRLTIGATGSLGPVGFSALLAKYHRHYPGVDLTVRQRASDDLAVMLRADALDFAFLSVTERIARPGLTLHRLVEEQLVLVLPRGHRLAGRKAVALDELRGETFVGFLEGTRLRELLVEAAHSKGFSPHIAFETDEVHRARDMVAEGLGVTALPRSEVLDAPDEVVVTELVEPVLHRDVTLAWRSERQLSPAARAFLDLATADID